MALHVTENACAVLRHLLENADTPEGQVIRLVMDSEGNMDLKLDSKQEDDQIITHNGDAVMVLEPQISEGLSGIVLDLKETDAGYAVTLSLEDN